jgi:DNA-directed RNA polymerase specialized sigma subunit
LGILSEIERKFEKARQLQEEVEKAFYKKVIAMSISLSNNNSDFIEDNFMEGARGLGKAIWRFDIMHGGVLAGFIEIWINNELPLFQPCNLIKVPTGMNSMHDKLQKEMEKGKSIAEAAKIAGMSEERARDVEFFLNKEADLRIDVAVGNGVEDEETKLPDELVQEFDCDEDNSELQEMIKNLDSKYKNVLCMYYGIFDELSDRGDISDEDVNKEIEAQKEESVK